MIKTEDIKSGNIINIGRNTYKVEVNTSNGDIKLIHIPVPQYIELNVVVVK